MKSRIHSAIIAGLFILFLTSPAFAGWKSKVTQNQLKATQYIAQLKNGANPNTIKRPQLRRDKKWEAKQSHKEIIAIMIQAEELAKTGKQGLIKKPVFKFNGLSEE
jgi:hypothetical protein